MYRFYSNPAETNRVTVVGNYVDGNLSLAASRCSNKDQFMRKRGRTIAENRLEKGKVIVTLPIKDFTIKDFVENATELAYHVKKNPKIIHTQLPIEVFGF
jgi:hypothetical protein